MVNKVYAQTFLSWGLKRVNVSIISTLSTLLWLLACVPGLTQIVPDKTLPVNSIVTPLGNTLLIEGGTTKGGNLFHSFERFSVPTGGTAFFDNALGIHNIFSRVTGGLSSNIDGVLLTNGSANLFLLNPNGIIFGPNARLSIGGEFLGSTASTINFEDGTRFSASRSISPPVLTVSVPVGLGFTSKPGAIRVVGTGHGLTLQHPIFAPFMRGSHQPGLQVQPGKTFALVGGDVFLEGGVLTAPGGRVELGAVEEGLVNINFTESGLVLGYGGVQNFLDVSLARESLADASGIGSGSINVWGGKVRLTDGSVFLIQNLGSADSGIIKVNASDSLIVSGTSPSGKIPSSLTSESLGTGVGGGIAISTSRLVVQSGATIGTKTYNAAMGGNVAIDASESLQLSGFSSINPQNFSLIAAGAFGLGEAGDITVNTKQLTILDGANLGTATFGRGNGGNVNVNATDIKLDGFTPLSVASALLSSSAGDGNAGILTINTSRLSLTNGGLISSSTAARGDSGSITINASEFVTLSGRAPSFGSFSNGFSSQIISAATIENPVVRQLFNLPPVPSGAAGDVTVNTSRLILNDGAIAVLNQGSGNAGTLRLNADSVFLDNRGRVRADAYSGGGGNIFLQARDLRLTYNAFITATAGTAVPIPGTLGGSGDGGNVTIDADTLVVLDSSNITANAAVDGRGGNIQITAQSIFRSPDSSITATSAKGPQFDGVVNIRDLGNDVRNSLTAPESNLVDTEQVLAGSCLATRNRAQGSFVVTGAGGLPITPYSRTNEWEVLGEFKPNTIVLRQSTPTEGSVVYGVEDTNSPSVRSGHSEDKVTQQVASLVAIEESAIAPSQNNTSVPPPVVERPWKAGDPIVEATALVRTADGRVMLVADTPDPSSAQSLLCHAENHQ